MDFSQYNYRAKAEAGRYIRVVDPFTREPLGPEDDPAMLFVRGFAAQSTQDRLREFAKPGDAEPKNETGFVSAHKGMIDNAMAYLVPEKTKGISLGKKAVKDDATMREFLDLSFPDWKRVKADGDDEATFQVVNLPFAKQVTDAAEDQAGFFSEAETA